MKKPVMLPVEATIHPGGLAARALEDPIGRFPKEKITSMCTHAHLGTRTHTHHPSPIVGWESIAHKNKLQTRESKCKGPCSLRDALRVSER